MRRGPEILAAFVAWAIHVFIALSILAWAEKTFGDTLTYQWDAVDGGTTYPLLYELQWSVQPDTWQSEPPTATETATAQTPALSPGDQVQARVRAYLDDNGTERATSDWSETHTYVKAPAVPANVIVISISVQVQ